MSLLILALCTVQIGPLDGKVGTIISDGQVFITSSSQDYVPYPPLRSHHQVQLRSDSRYADDDPILWPQPFIPYFLHYGVIPQPYSFYEHQVIWWMPSHDHFIHHVNAASPVSGLGKLSDMKFGGLYTPPGLPSGSAWILSRQWMPILLVFWHLQSAWIHTDSK
jgi:hypothetical protein